MKTLHVERIGGLAGFGGAGSHVRSRGQLDLGALPAAVQEAIEALFAAKAKPGKGQVPDGFWYKITRVTAAGSATIEVPESVVPAVVTGCVKDELI